MTLTPNRTLAVILLSACAARGQLAHRWLAEATRTAPQEIAVYRGETLALEPTVTVHGEAYAWPQDTSVTLWWQTNGMGSAWWSAPAALGAETGALRAVWSPACDAGADRYTFFIRSVSPSGTAYRASGTLRMIHSPGAEPNALPLPVQTLDFSVVTLTNAPWLTAADWASGSNALASALQDLSGRIDALPPPPVVPVVSVNGYTGAVSITAASLGALTAEADPVAGPRLDLIEPETNKWNAAYAWGDHALAGYLLPAALSPYATTQQVADAAAAIPRDRITTLDGSQWIDATGGVWRVSYGGGGYWTISILGTLYGSATNAYYEVRSAPFDFWNYDQAFWDGDAYFRWYPDGDPGYGKVYVEIQGVEEDHDYNSPTNDLADGVFEFYTSATYTHFVLAWSNDLSSATTQRVDGVAWQSDLSPYATTQTLAAALAPMATTQHVAEAIASQLPGIVYSNSVSALTIYTNASGAATSWWQVASGVTNSGTFASGTSGAITNGQTGPLTLGKLTLSETHPNVAVDMGGTTQWGVDITGNPWDADGHDNNQDRAVVRIASDGTWSGTQYALYVKGYTYLSGFRIYGAGPERNLYKSTEIGFGSPVAMRFSTDKFALPELRITPGVVRANYELAVAGTNTAAVVRSQSGYLLPHLGTNTTISLIFTNGTLQAWEIAQ